MRRVCRCRLVVAEALVRRLSLVASTFGAAVGGTPGMGMWIGECCDCDLLVS